MKRIAVAFIALVLVSNVIGQEDTVLYSFFSAGHTYGNPNTPHPGLHYPFVEYIPKIRNYPKKNEA